MSQLNVERAIGLLVTDEALRRRFVAAPESTLQELAERGISLNPCELRALACLNLHELVRFAELIDPRLQKTDLQGGIR